MRNTTSFCRGLLRSYVLFIIVAMERVQTAKLLKTSAQWENLI